MYLVTSTDSRTYNVCRSEAPTLELAREAAQAAISAGNEQVTIWQRHSTAALESRVVFQHHGSGEGRKVGEFNDVAAAG